MKPNGGIPLEFDSTPTAAIAAREDGARLVSDLDGYLRRFVVLTLEQSIILVFFILHTYVYDVGMFTPYIHVWSAVMRSGKTRLLEVLKLFVRDPWLTQRMSVAALMRKIDKTRPTLLLDESDTAFAADKEYSEALRGMLNAGFQKGGVATICVKKNGDWEPEDFHVFCPKVIAGIGMDKLPGTVRDRSIPIELKRRGDGEVIEDFDTEDEIQVTRPTRLRIEKWAEQNRHRLKGWAKPEKLTALSDRQRDICNPLLKIADMIADDVWMRKLSDALVSVLTTRTDDEGAGIKLLSDIKSIMDGEKDEQKGPKLEKIFSIDLVKELATIEVSPWAEWKAGKPITQVQLARMLKPFKVYPKTIRIEPERNKGYEREAFEDTWRRYLRAPSSISGLRSVTAVTTRANTDESHDSSTRDVTGQVTDQKCVSFNKDAACHVVTDQTPDVGMRKEFRCESCGAFFDTSVGRAKHMLHCT